jgi:hypothetical protein
MAQRAAQGSAHGLVAVAVVAHRGLAISATADRLAALVRALALRGGRAGQVVQERQTPGRVVAVESLRPAVRLAVQVARADW